MGTVVVNANSKELIASRKLDYVKSQSRVLSVCILFEKLQIFQITESAEWEFRFEGIVSEKLFESCPCQHPFDIFNISRPGVPNSNRSLVKKKNCVNNNI